MSNLFKQISQEAERQRQEAERLSSTTSPIQSIADTQQPIKPVRPPVKKVAPQNGTTVPKADTTVPQLDLDKLQTVIRELSQLETNNNGLNVRLSAQEALDLDEFVHGVLRKRGLKGHEVSATKLLRYAFRYLSRVHEKEFVAAIEQALKVEDKLSI